MDSLISNFSKKLNITSNENDNNVGKITNIIKIQRWWRKNNSILELKKILNYIKNNLTESDLYTLVNSCKSITTACKGDGVGLSSGYLIDMYISKFFTTKLTEYREYHQGESDMKIYNIPLSQKKITGKSEIALDWSKNESKNKITVKVEEQELEKDKPKTRINTKQNIKNKTKQHFSSHILIINLKTSKWWKSEPKNIINKKIIYNDIIKSGIYLIDKKYCKNYIKLSKNNKTNTLIEHKYVYAMLKRSMQQQLYIELPEPNKILEFNILNAFL